MKPSLLAWFVFWAGVAAGMGCPTNSQSDCQQVCDWYVQRCTSESVDGCVQDCLGSNESASDAVDRCVNGNGWGDARTCQSAGCCVRWVYDDYASRCG